VNRQAPQYTIIGNGRVARHLCQYFDLLEVPYSHWHRSLDLSTLNNCIENASHIIVAISDDSIETFIKQFLCNKKIIIHCSGSLTTELAYSAHPLQTFSEKLYSIEEYKKIPFVIEAEGPEFTTLLPGLPNPHFKINRAQKPLYHALCVMANNFTTILWQKVFREFEGQLGIDRCALMPILAQTTTNLTTHANSALTGPIARNDTTTIQKNLNALQEDSFYDIYQAFVDSTKTHEHT
jgi:predicted short-subunit dehydrogenase-like oxidoreductase (DUF2520 family)